MSDRHSEPQAYMPVFLKWDQEVLEHANDVMAANKAFFLDLFRAEEN